MPGTSGPAAGHRASFAAGAPRCGLAARCCWHRAGGRRLPATAPASPTATDEDGPATAQVSCSPASGSTFAIGTSTVTCTATDTDDTNSPVTRTFTVTVKGAADQLSDLYSDVHGVGPGTSLPDKVAQAQSYLTANDLSDTCSTLSAFTNEVHAQAGIHIAVRKSNQLIVDAQRIRAVLGCRVSPMYAVGTVADSALAQFR